MMNKRNKKGFTLVELLIVVAIIAVLVAISIPIFLTELEKSKEATDIANIRAGYAQAREAAILGDDTLEEDDGVSDGMFVAGGISSETGEEDNYYTFRGELVQGKDGWQCDDVEVAGIKLSEFVGEPTQDGWFQIECTSDGWVQITLGKGSQRKTVTSTTVTGGN